MCEKFLSIIIPFCKKDIVYLISFLQNIDTQKNINWDDIEVIYCASSIQDPPTPFPEFNNIHPIFAGESHNISGPGVSRNIGIKAATGKYIIVCDADDKLNDDYSLYNLLCELKSKDSDMVDAIEFVTQVGNEENMSYYDAEKQGVIPINIWMYAFRSAMFRKYNLEFRNDCYLFEDNDFICRAIMRGMRFSYSRVCWYTHVTRDDNISGSDAFYKASFLQDIYIVTLNFIKEFPNPGQNINVWSWMLGLYPHKFYELWSSPRGAKNWNIDDKRIQMYNFIAWTMMVWPTVSKICEENHITDFSPELIEFINRASVGKFED